MKLLVVESPAKSKTISKYLGGDFVVVPSIGHVRDLDPHDGSVDVDNDFSMTWAIMPGKEKQIKEIEKYIKKVDEVYLATDPDREGEAISWHIVDILKERKSIDKPIHRVVFHEITKSAVSDAIKNPRDIDDKLVDAYLARRALDFLVGFKLSPVLWRKLPGCKSAGRVQSVALKLICERESEIEKFTKKEYWSIEGSFETLDKKLFGVKLISYNGTKLDKFDIPNQDKATEILNSLTKDNDYIVSSIERKKQQRKPVAPFTTSTLQQEASRKLGFSAKQTMQIAQKLYEGIDIGGETVGLITYMRTDSVNLSKEALEAIRTVIGEKFGSDYLPKDFVSYDNKSKNAQEAHEAIRPTYINKTPDNLKKYLDANQFKLYELIWKRAVASQMKPAELDLVAADITNNQSSVFRANGSMVVFDGFMKLYKEDKDDVSDNNENKLLPLMNENDKVVPVEIKPEQHFTQPPPRYTEASLVKKMEELGIGRPSTYASILSVIQERHYADLVKKRFVPQDRGRIVSVFLSSYFSKYVEYDFTAFMENELDEISNGLKNYKDVLNLFWKDFKQSVDASFDLSMENIINNIDRELGSHFFPDNNESRKCPDCKTGKLGIKLGKFGGFIGCSNYPTCKYTKPLILNDDAEESDNESKEEKVVSSANLVLGISETGENIYLKKGPYGMYLQLGEVIKGDVRGPVRVSIPKNILPDTLTLEQAKFLLSMPKSLGFDGEDEVFIANGKYGAYLKKANKIKSIPSSMNIFDIDIKIAHDLLLDAVEKDQGIELGSHPDDGKPVKYFSRGKFGPYVQHNRVFVSIPASVATKDTITLEIALKKLSLKESNNNSKKK